MNEKLLAGLIAAVAIAPLCAVCILGPTVIASIFTGIAAWFGGLDTIVTVGLVLVAGNGIFAAVRRRKSAPARPVEEMSQ